jgi:hypothetical protein
MPYIHHLVPRPNQLCCFKSVYAGPELPSVGAGVIAVITVVVGTRLNPVGQESKESPRLLYRYAHPL